MRLTYFALLLARRFRARFGGNSGPRTEGTPPARRHTSNVPAEKTSPAHGRDAIPFGTGRAPGRRASPGARISAAPTSAPSCLPRSFGEHALRLRFQPLDRFAQTCSRATEPLSKRRVRNTEHLCRFLGRKVFDRDQEE